MNQPPWLNRLLVWAGHPLWAAFFTVLLAPLFIWLGWVWYLPIIGVVFGAIHEAVQWEWDWLDIVDFTIGGVWASVWIWLMGVA